MTDDDTREAERQYSGVAAPHSERPGHFLRRQSESVLTPEALEEVRAEVRDEFRKAFALHNQLLKPKPAADAPGNQGGPVAEERGPATSEYGWTRWALYAGAGLAVVFAVLAILSAFGYRVDLEYVRQLAELFQWMIVGVVGYAVSRGMAKAGKP